MNLGDVLRIARARMEEPTKVCRSMFVANLDGSPWQGAVEKAPCMCPLNHLLMASGADPDSWPMRQAVYAALLELSGAVPDRNYSMIIAWWDQTHPSAAHLIEPTHGNLLRVMDFAIERAGTSSELLV